MINSNFNILAAIISFSGAMSYLIDTLKGKVKPNKVTWSLWAIAPLIAFFAEIKQGVGLQSLLTFMFGFNPLLIFLASFVNKKSYWKISKLDLICGIVSVLGLLLWYITKIGNIAIIFSILADGFASLPTLVKSFKDPKSESYLVYLLSSLSALITLFTIKIWTLAYFGFPLYWFIISLLLFVIIKFKLGKILYSNKK